MARWLVLSKGEETPTAEEAPSLVADMQGRYLIGLHELLPVSSTDLDRQVTVLNSGSVGQRLHYVILVGELDGPLKALERLDQIEKQWAANNVQLTQRQQKLCGILHRLYTDYAYKQKTTASLDETDSTWLRQQLGWWGDLALAPKETSDSAAHNPSSPRPSGPR